MANSETDVLIENLLNPSSGGDGSLFASSANNGIYFANAAMHASPANNIASCPAYFSILKQPNGEVLLHIKQLIIETTTGATLTNQDGIILNTSDYAGFMLQATAIERALLHSSDTLPSSSGIDEFLKDVEQSHPKDAVQSHPTFVEQSNLKDVVQLHPTFVEQSHLKSDEQSHPKDVEQSKLKKKKRNPKKTLEKNILYNPRDHAKKPSKKAIYSKCTK